MSKAISGKNSSILFIALKLSFSKENYEQALLTLQKLKKIIHSRRDLVGLGKLHSYYGLIFIELKKISKAFKTLNYGLSISLKTRDRLGELSDYINIGDLLITMGRKKQAKKMLTRGLKLAKNLKLPPQIKIIKSQIKSIT